MKTTCHFQYVFFVCFLSFTASNLKKLIETVTEYYSEVLTISLSEFISPNVMRIAEHSDQNELGRFLQLILGKLITVAFNLQLRCVFLIFNFQFPTSRLCNKLYNKIGVHTPTYGIGRVTTA